MDIKMILSIILYSSLVSICTCIYENQQYKEQPQYKAEPPQYKAEQQQQQYYKPSGPKKPPPRILSHHQAQNHDGGFKFAFSAENGLQQSEVIAPDGSRNGGYQYVDAYGKTITVKYTAGKEGFKILQGDHIPRENSGQQAAPHQQPQQPRLYQPQQPYQQQQYQYRPLQIQPYQQPQPQHQPPPIPHYLRENRNEVQYNQDRYQPQPSPAIFKQQFVAQRPYVPPQAPQPRSYEPPQVRSYEQKDNSASNSVEEEEKEPEYNDEPGKANSFGVGYAFHFST